MTDFWRWLGEPLNLTAVATGVLAVLAAVALVANVILTAATWRATKLQSRELRLFEAQLQLAQEQAKAARALTKPEIRANVTKMTDQVVVGHLVWSHGSSPAYEIEVWVKLADGRLLLGRPRYMAPGDRRLDFVAGQKAAANASCPFPSFSNATPPRGEYWLGVTWRAADSTFWGYSVRVVEEHPGLDDEGRPVTFGEHSLPGPDPMLPEALGPVRTA
jgi:hypothetical protein